MRKCVKNWSVNDFTNEVQSVWKIISFPRVQNCARIRIAIDSRRSRVIVCDFNGKSSIKSHLQNVCASAVQSWRCDNGKINDYKWIWQMPSIIFKRLRHDLPFLRWPFRHRLKRVPSLSLFFFVPSENKQEDILSFISLTCVTVKSSRESLQPEAETVYT